MSEKIIQLNEGSAPDLYAIFYEPLDHKRRFIITPSETVKHEYQQNIKLSIDGIALNLLNRISVFCGYFESGDTFFGEFFDDMSLMRWLMPFWNWTGWRPPINATCIVTRRIILLTKATVLNAISFLLRCLHPKSTSARLIERVVIP